MPAEMMENDCRHTREAFSLRRLREKITPSQLKEMSESINF